MRQSTHRPIVLSLFALLAASSLSVGGCGGTGTFGTQQTLNTPGLAQTANPNSTKATATSPRGGVAALGQQAAILLTGGSSGASTSPTTATATTGAANANTSNFADNYDRVYVTIHKIELLDTPAEKRATGQEAAHMFWESAEGVAVDVRALRGDGSAIGIRSKLLALATIPPTRSYTRARLTLGKTLLVFANKSQKGDNLPFSANVARDADARPVVSFAFERPVTFGANDSNVVIEFDVNAFVKENDAVTPIVRAGRVSDVAVADVARQQASLFVGTLDGLSGENEIEKRSFVVIGAGQKIPVQLARRTVLYNAPKDDSATLADKQVVRVRGAYDLTTKRVIAESVEIVGSGDDAATKAERQASLYGNASDASDAKAGGQTFAVSPEMVHGLSPAQGTMLVTLAPDAVLRSRGGLLLTTETFFDALELDKNAKVTVVGTYDASLGTFTATRAKLEGATNGGREAAVLGALKTGAKGDDLALSSAQAWEGLLSVPTGDKSMTVTISSATVLRNEKGDLLSRETLLAKIKGGTADAPIVAKVVGLMDAKGNILTATRIELRSADALKKPTSATAPVAEAKPATTGDAPKPATPTSDVPKETSPPAK